MAYLFFASRHFVFAAAINYIYLFSAKTFCCTRGIHSNVSSTDNGNIFTYIYRSCNIRKLVCTH